METPARVRAVVTDVDGTIVDDDGTVDDGTVSAATLHAAVELSARGVPLIAATGRTPAGIRAIGPLLPYLESAVCCGGSLGWAPATGQLTWQDTIAAATVREIVHLATSSLPAAGIAAYDARRWTMTAGYVSARGSSPRGPCDVVTVAELGDRPACAMAICHPELGAADIGETLVAAGLDTGRTSLAYSGPRLLDIAPAGVDKATGVSRALDALGVAPADTIAFGDMPNDLPMLRLCGYAVAVGNAHPDVLAAAATVTRSVREDGFARLLTDLGIVNGMDRF